MLKQIYIQAQLLFAYNNKNRYIFNPCNKYDKFVIWNIIQSLMIMLYKNT